MTTLGLPAFALAMMLASCAEEAAPDYDEFGSSFIEELVQRFDVQGCVGANVVRAGRNPDEKRPGAKNVYVVDERCIADMKQAFDVIGFEKIGKSTYKYTSGQGWYEIVQLTPAGDRQEAGIIWETIDP